MSAPAFLVYNTALAGAAAIALLAIQRWCRPRPAVAHALWLLALLQLCWPPCLRLPVPLLPVAAQPAAVDAAAVEPGAIGAEPVPTARLAVAAPALAAVPSSRATSVPAPAPAPAAWNEERLAWVWALGSALALASVVLLLLRSHVRFRRAPAAAAWLQAEVEALAERLRQRAPDVVEHAAAATPFVWPFGRPRLVASSAALLALPLPVRTAVLAHELAHLKRRDHLWVHAEILLGAAFFWHPLFWFLRARVREQAELACDAWALEVAPKARLGYARVLVDALRTAHPVPALPVLAARPGARRAFERRLSMILQQSVPSRLSCWAALGVVALGFAGAVTPVAAQERGERPRVEIRVDGVPVEQLDAQKRERLLRALGLEGEALRLALQARAVETAAEEPAVDAAPPRRPRRDVSPEKARDVRPVRAREVAPEQDPAPPRRRDAAPPTGTGGLLRGVLAEVRDELQRDPDLQELGLTDAVVGLVDAVGDGREFQGALQRVIDQAITGAGKLAQREIAAEPELQRLGIADDVGRLVTSLLENGDVRQGLGDIARKAMQQAVGEARAELQSDPGLRELGIADEVDELLKGLEAGRLDLEALEPLIDEAVRGAVRAAGEARDGAKRAERSVRRQIPR